MTKTIIITGASDGIGAAAARQLSANGHRVVVVGRSAAKTAAVATEIGAEYFVADFAELSQVRRLADQLLAAYPSIDVLADNAGGIMGERTLTVDGYEKTFQVNHLATFLLTTLLLPSLEAGGATVIQTSSRAARLYGKFDIHDLQNAHGYAPQTAYGNAKLANILFTKELQRRYSGRGIAAVAFHPGVVGTNFASDTTHIMRRLYHGPLKRLLTLTPTAGADQLVWLAEGTPGVTFEPGGYYESRKLATRVNAAQNDARLAEQLWDESAALV
ncbi:SDR family NAD(P)-dependent oxidoreductase [Cryobacterium sp. CG_9.6]|uniref:SDR family NAD(P)-dependent oxidoreductase n=1 Tax=Cryobacterium sp. CG_9.6 TaxID=2760710 RepID=UPI002473B59E|nr:SDR family NAD(P)-dependent oxidoreductase [Cryobacterium sp. CG_9.6]MDH6237803.1 NAD(P)-dependent dehydrogenase (short-subunit alcohol dehydrogenase family) [Cryobacterium sp. CG_9.6]